MKYIMMIVTALIAAVLVLVGCNSEYDKVKKHTGRVVERFIRTGNDESAGVPVIVLLDDSLGKRIPINVSMGVYSNTWVGKYVTLYLSQDAIDMYSR